MNDTQLKINEFVLDDIKRINSKLIHELLNDWDTSDGLLCAFPDFLVLHLQEKWDKLAINN